MVEQYIRESTIDDQRESHSEHRLSSYDCRSIVHLRVRRCLRAVPYKEIDIIIKQKTFALLFMRITYIDYLCLIGKAVWQCITQKYSSTYVRTFYAHT